MNKTTIKKISFIVIGCVITLFAVSKIITSIQNSKEEQKYNEWATYEGKLPIMKIIEPIVKNNENYSDNNVVKTQMYKALNDTLKQYTGKPTDLFTDVHFKFEECVPNGDKEAVVRFSTSFGIHYFKHNIELEMYCTMNIDEARQLTKDSEYILTEGIIQDYKPARYLSDSRIVLGEFLILNAHINSVKSIYETIYN